MPIYEFYCPDNNRLYSFFARSLAQADRVPRCPDHPSWRMRKVVSGFAVVGRAQEPSPTPPTGPAAEPDDPRMDRAMAEMEREMSGMDEDHPDPRQLGRMMRRMAELTGEKMPPEMGEMLKRLEAGEDPEKLESEYGDLLGDGPGEGDEGFGAGGEAAPGAPEPPPGEGQPRLRRLRPPRRDPKLYELADYL